MNAVAGEKVLVRWQDEFSVGIDGVDDQHRKLLDLINGLWDAIVRGAGNDELLALVDELERYTGYHFSDEEVAMRVAGYPQLVEHSLAHRGFVERVGHERERLRQGGHASLELVRFLQDWLLRHIAVQDKHYAAFVMESSARLSFFARLLRRFA